MQVSDTLPVVVVGAGLAGLTAAATAARAGKPVTVVEAHDGGGRARTDERSGYRFNRGAHGLFWGGEAWRILHELNVPYCGHMPLPAGARVAREGKCVRLVGATMGKLITKILLASPSAWTGRSAHEWADALGASRDLAATARMAIRATTYVDDLENMPADLAISQLKKFRGATYLDGGWATLVEGLWSVASGAGATIRKHQAAAAVNPTTGGCEVTLAGGEVIRASAAVIAAGGPETAAKLLPALAGWADRGRKVTAACLDLGLQGRSPSLLIGLDEPLYLARHSPPASLAPRGGSVAHVLRYGARNAQLDRSELRDFARLSGISDDQVVEERFLADMVVTHLLPTPEQGLAGRPDVTSTGVVGVYLAGDWVGPTGWLTDAAVASGRRAGHLAAGVPQLERTMSKGA